MQQVLLIRHAKAAAYGHEPGDHSRPLSAKGHEHALALGEMLAKAGCAPDIGMISTAQRTLETWQDMSASFGKCALHLQESLYLASPKTLAQAARQYGKGQGTLALVAHNPGIALLAHQLFDQGFNHDREAAHRLGENFKTGWAAAFEMREEGPRLVHLFDPRDL